LCKGPIYSCFTLIGMKYKEIENYSGDIEYFHCDKSNHLGDWGHGFLFGL